ncbi:hypothetical protein LCGC14_2513470, partial [marine sediment metagenome]
MLKSVDSLKYRVKKIRSLKERRREKLDRQADRTIDGYLTRKNRFSSWRPPVKSELIDIDTITEAKITQTKFASFEKFTEIELKEIENINKLCRKEGNSEIKVHQVENIDGGKGFNIGRKVLPKYTFQLGNSENPQFKILVLASTHGGESRLARAVLQGIIQLTRPGEERYKLLEKGTILFDPVVDPAGFDNQTRGAVSRDGTAVNAPLLGGGWAQPGLGNPWGLSDRNSAQGRNSLEAQDVLTRSNQVHYKRILAGRASWVYDAHETCEFTHCPDLAFTYGGILLMAHIYFSHIKLASLNQLESCIGWWRKLRSFINDHNPLEGPLYREQLLWHDPLMQKIVRVRNRIRELGQRTMEEKFDRAFLFLPHVERDIRIEESVYIGGMMFRIPRILLGPDVLGLEGVTTESFQQDLVARAKQTLASLE